jgi:hypothetical protein
MNGGPVYRNEVRRRRRRARGAFRAIASAAAALLSAFAIIAPAATGRSAIADLAKIYDGYPLIFMGEWHRNAQQHEFLRKLIADPAFLCRTDDIVIEFGNARLQPVADRWSTGEPVSEAELVSMFRETEVMFAWNAPMYRQFYEAVREVNKKRLCPHPVRLVLGDPAFDWAKIETAEQFRALPDRDRFFADVVAREVLAKKHRALLISGALHALRKYPQATPEGSGFAEPSAAQLIEKEHPGSLFIVALVTTPAAAETMRMPPPPSFRLVRGSALEKLNFAIIAPAWSAKPVVVNGKHEWQLEDSDAWAPMGEVVDGVLYLGGDETRVFPPPSIYLDPVYQQQLRKRAAIIKAWNGQDFGVILDDLIKEAEAAQKTQH